ncbi:uncharacterized protein LOC110993280 [Pieris rapae]|uniref:uncharacterized protein LOC110993280 n=1 Tax=Pieris rapae TaxID=64459 RepID=UPI001E27B6E6|nr:uncharacterized protein LOC110993280 [Pieris rapae]
MDFKPKKSILHFSSECEELGMLNINLGKGDMEEIIEIIRQWIEKQPHFKSKNFSTNYLKMSILGAKGSIERVKSLLDKSCTLRTLLPHYFQFSDMKSDLKELFEIVTPVILPNYSKDNARIFIMKFWSDIKKSSQITELHKNSIRMIEYIMQVDNVSSMHMCIDLLNINVFDLVSKQNPFELKDVATITMGGYGTRVKGVHCITTSKYVDAFVALLKQVLSPKLISRIHVYRTWSELYDVLGKDVIPIEFGGNEKSIREIHDDWQDELSSEEFKKYLEERSKMCTDESLRPKDRFNDEYAGMPGSFRVLSVD